MSDLPIGHGAAVNFYILAKAGRYAFRRMYHVPRIGDFCVFSDVRYEVARVEWCLDEGATERGVRVNVELKAVG
jgi:hypothetical protein